MDKDLAGICKTICLSVSILVFGAVIVIAIVAGSINENKRIECSKQEIEEIDAHQESPLGNSCL